MRIGYRHGDPRHPFLWEDPAQPPARWHGAGEGPAHYLADTPDGAWAEYLRHEGIVAAEDLDGVTRTLWAVKVDDNDVDAATPIDLPADLSIAAYPACQEAARRARAAGAIAIVTGSAALLPGHAAGLVVDGGIHPGMPPTDGQVWVLFGPRPDLRGWRCVERGAPGESLLGAVRLL